MTQRGALAIVTVAATVLSACSGLSSTSTSPTTSPVTPDTTAGPPTTGPDAPTTTQTTQPGDDERIRPEYGTLVVLDHAIVVQPTGGDAFRILGDIDTPLATAFDDYNGGIIFQYTKGLDGPARPILHLPPGGATAIELITPDRGETLTLEDVTVLDDRIHVVYTARAIGRPTGGRLLAADVRGGSAVELYSGNDLIGGSVFADLVALELNVGPTCGKIQVLKDEVSVFEIDCEDRVGPRGTAIGESGEVLATIVDGTIRGFDTGSGAAAGGWVPPASNELFDIEVTTVAVRDNASTYRLETSDGVSVRYEMDGPVRFVSFLRSPPAVLGGPRLGGVVGPAVSCSAGGMATRPTDQQLPDPVQATRNAIIEEATSCDFRGLAALTPTDFEFGADGTGNPRRHWLASEQDFGDDLAVIVTVLSLPSTTIPGPDGTQLYVWPSAATSNPTEADWEAVAAIYNEEEVAAMRRNGGYSGLRIGILEDGRWIFATTNG
ncbi:MAG: hypothetical protein OEO77_00330 [Acidimicrobiia bacterium]|nr:hypothetical protein [Acidimicrobiia bacterium]